MMKKVVSWSGEIKISGNEEVQKGHMKVFSWVGSCLQLNTKEEDKVCAVCVCVCVLVSLSM
ncbi:hypothetical protein Hanom_Chr10g00882441 [Helianthus anomalus]